MFNSVKRSVAPDSGSLTDVTSQTLIHGGVGGEARRELPALSGSFVLLWPFTDRLQTVDSGEVCTWHGSQYSSPQHNTALNIAPSGWCEILRSVLASERRVEVTRLEYLCGLPGPALLRELSPCPMLTQTTGAAPRKYRNY